MERYKGTGGGRVTKHWPSDRVGKAKRDVCVWELGSNGVWTGSCGAVDSFLFGVGPIDIGVDRCFDCGKKKKKKVNHK